MLTVRKIGSMQAGDYSAYLTGRADDEQAAWRDRGDYYTGEHAAGEWAGDDTPLAKLGVQSGEPVDREQLARALRGQSIHGEQLRVPGANGVVNSHDLTFGCPKSVSVLWAQSGAEQRELIESALRDSAEQSVRYLALTTPCVQRRVGQRERVWEPAAGVACATFVHHTARSTKESALPDPHLHVHCVVVAAERSDGRIVTPNQAAWMRHAREGGAYFRAELASRLNEVGIEIDPQTGKGGRFFEVAGVPTSVCEQLSGRSREVDLQRAKFVRRYGRLPQERELADLAIKSRERKVVYAAAELEPYWQAVCAEHGFDRAAAARVWAQEHEIDMHRARESVAERLPQLVAGQGATARTRDVRAMAYEAAAGRLDAADTMQVVDELQRAGRLIALADDRVTTVDVRAQEHYVLNTAHALAARSGSATSPASLRTGIDIAERSLGSRLSVEQSEAARALTGDARIATLVGPAGSGKGTVIRAASEAYRAEGRQVVCVATQGATAQRLGGQAAAPAFTIDGLLARVQHERLSLDSRSVVFADEAAMVDTHRFAGLLRLSEQHGASLRLIGDPQQLTSIGAGGLFEKVGETGTTASLSQVHRARERWLIDAQTAVRDGRSQDALAIMREQNAAHMLDTQADAKQRMVDDWNSWRHDYDPGDSLLVVHTSNDNVDNVNELCQAKRIAAGELGADALPAPDRDYELHEGDRVIFRERPYGFDDPSEQRVENGTRGVIDHVDHDANTVRVTLDESVGQARTVDVELDRCAALRLDYASHVYPAQGDTRSRTAELTGGAGTSKEAAYVGGSRTRDRHDLYTSREALGVDGTDEDRWTRLADQMNTTRAQQPSIDFHEQDRRIASELPPSDLDVARTRLADVERQLDSAIDARDSLDRTRPRGVENQIHLLEKQRRESLNHAESNRRRQNELEQRMDRLPFWKRDERERLERDARHAADSAERNWNRYQQADRTITELREGPDSPERWQRQHGPDLARRESRVRDLEHERDARRAAVTDRALERPPSYLKRALGPRPHDNDQRLVWDKAAREVEQYRQQHRVRDRVTPLGRRPASRSIARGIAHSAAQRAIGTARQALSPTRIARSYLSAVMTLARFVERDPERDRAHKRDIRRGIDFDGP